MPAAGARHIFPRSDLPLPARPVLIDDNDGDDDHFLRFLGNQWITTRRPVPLPAGRAPSNVSFGAWLRTQDYITNSVLFDNRDNRTGGGVLGMSGLAPFIFLPCAGRNVEAPTLRTEPGRWNYVGATVAIVAVDAASDTSENSVSASDAVGSRTARYATKSTGRASDCWIRLRGGFAAPCAAPVACNECIFCLCNLVTAAVSSCDQCAAPAGQTWRAVCSSA